MQFFYIDYYNNDKKERNIGFLKLDYDGFWVGLRGVPIQASNPCEIYGVNEYGEKLLLGRVPVKNGYGMEKISWTSKINFENLIKIEIPLYGTRFAECVIRELKTNSEKAKNFETKNTAIINVSQNETVETKICKGQDITEKIAKCKWEQLINTYQQVHIYPEAQTILIKPKDIIVLTKQYHILSANSFLLHSYYNYRQLLLFRYPYGTENLENKTIDLRALQQSDISDSEYYIGVAGIYNERECRLAQLFGFEGFECGEARMNEESKRTIYTGCFGYYMKKVEI